jgi:hypothetical protein
MRTIEREITDGGPKDKRLDDLLSNWSAWMRVGTVGRGYPTKIPGLRSVGGTDFDTMVSDVDLKLARAIDALIDSLQPNHRVAIHHVHLASVWRLRLPIEDLYPAARVALRVLMARRRVE